MESPCSLLYSPERWEDHFRFPSNSPGQSTFSAPAFCDLHQFFPPRSHALKYRDLVHYGRFPLWISFPICRVKGGFDSDLGLAFSGPRPPDFTHEARPFFSFHFRTLLRAFPAFLGSSRSAKSFTRSLLSGCGSCRNPLFLLLGKVLLFDSPQALRRSLINY